MFFTQFAEMLKGHNVNMIMSMENGTMYISLFPRAKKDVSNVVDMFPPLNLKATPQEFDQGFFSRISVAMEKTGGIVTNMKIYADQLRAKEEEAKKKATEKTTKKTTASSTTSKPANNAQPTMFDSSSDNEKSEE